MSANPHDAESWANYLSEHEIPVLKHTAREMGKLLARVEDIGVRDIALVCNHDPLMAFRILRYMQNHRHKNQAQELVLVEQAIMMMGLGTFFEKIPPIPVAEEFLKENIPALTRLMYMVNRSNRAAHFAFEFAMMLNDIHVQEVRIAALMHDLSETLLWCFAPDNMLKIYQMQKADKTLRSAVAQQNVFGFRFHDLQRLLIQKCHLPHLLEQLMDDHEANNPRVKSVLLAVNIARHSANGWEDAALPDDYQEIAQLLRVDIKKARRIVGAPDETLW